MAASGILHKWMELDRERGGRAYLEFGWEGGLIGRELKREGVNRVFYGTLLNTHRITARN